jgi:hypothetical protein
MDILLSVTTNEAGRFYKSSTEKVTVSVSVCRHYMQVCVHNASASLNRNLGGKVFHNEDRFAQAIDAYKSAAVKAILEKIRDEEAKHQPAILTYTRCHTEQAPTASRFQRQTQVDTLNIAPG